MDNNSGLKGIDFSPEINMARYLQKIRTYPLLSQDEEYNLAVKYKQTKDQELAKILVNSHLRLVVKVVSKYRGYGLSLAEMISEYLKKLPKTERQVFVCRYYYLDSLSDISERFGFSRSKIASMLHRTRKKLLSHLEKEGVLYER